MKKVLEWFHFTDEEVASQWYVTWQWLYFLLMADMVAALALLPDALTTKGRKAKFSFSQPPLQLDVVIWQYWPKRPKWDSLDASEKPLFS